MKYLIQLVAIPICLLFAASCPRAQSAKVSVIGKSTFNRSLLSAMTGTPKIGTSLSFKFFVTNTWPFSESYYLMLGDSRSKFGGMSLPRGIRVNFRNQNPVRFINITLYCSWLGILLSAPIKNQQTFTLGVPNDTRLLGLKFYLQALNIAGSSNPYSTPPIPSESWHTTEALELTIGK